LIFVDRDLDGMTRRGNGRILRLGLLSEDVDTGDLILDILESGNNRFPVIGDSLAYVAFASSTAAVRRGSLSRAR
jgi:hypothetical protein